MRVCVGGGGGEGGLVTLPNITNDGLKRYTSKRLDTSINSF